MAKRTRKMGKGKEMACSSDMNDDDDMDDEDKMAKGGAVRSKGKGLQQVSGFKFSGTY